MATNPLIDATLLGLLAKAVHLPVYAVPAFASALKSLAGVATPLCLFILGASFAPAGVSGYARSLWITVFFGPDRDFRGYPGPPPCSASGAWRWASCC